MTNLKAAVSKAKDCYWHFSRRGVKQEGFSVAVDGYRWQGENQNGKEWVVYLNSNGSYATAWEIV